MKGHSGAGAVLSEPRAGQRAQLALGGTAGPIFSQSNNAVEGNKKNGVIQSWSHLACICSWLCSFLNRIMFLQVEENIKVRRSPSIILEYRWQILFHFSNLLRMLRSYAESLAWKYCFNILRQGASKNKGFPQNSIFCCFLLHNKKICVCVLFLARCKWWDLKC